MSKQERVIHKLSDLPYYREEFTKQLEELGITSLSELNAALSEEESKQEIIDALEGVGPKIAEQWRHLTEAAVAEEEEKEEEPAAPSKPAKAAKATKVKKEEPEAEEVEAPRSEVVDKDEYAPKAKPELDARTVAMMKKRREISDRRPEFLRQEWFRFPRLGEKWRKPRGLHSKMRMHIKYRPTVVSIGFRGPKDVRGLHPSGFQEVMIYNSADLEGIDPKKQAARVGGKVGFKKRLEIEARADELGIRILNRTG